MRLGVSQLIGILLGTLTMAVTRYFGGARAVDVWIFSALVVASVASCAVALFLLRKPWDLDRFTRQFVLLIFFTYLGGTFVAFADHFSGRLPGQVTMMGALVSTLSLQGVTLLLLPLFLREHGLNVRDAFGLGLKWKMAVLLGVLVACVFMPVGQLVQWACGEILSRLHINPEVQQSVEIIKGLPALRDRVVLGIITALLAPLGEEVLFRGILYPTVARYGFPRLAIWGTSFLFAAIHHNLVTFVPLLVLAVVLTILYKRTGNLLAPIVAHATFNILNFVGLLIIESKMANPA